jgi:CBS domain containing-hemolysin-like protein
VIIDLPFVIVSLIVGELQTDFPSSGSIILNVLAILFLVFLNGFFVASEFALVKVRSTQLDALPEDDKKAEFARRVTSHLDAYLSATQLGITLSSLALGWIGEPYLSRLIGPLLVQVGLTSPVIIHGIY